MTLMQPSRPPWLAMTVGALAGVVLGAILGGVIGTLLVAAVESLLVAMYSPAQIVGLFIATPIVLVFAVWGWRIGRALFGRD